VAGGLKAVPYFQVLGLRPQVGRFFTPGANEHAYGQHDEVVLSDREWRVRFNADPRIVGQAITINRHPFTVIGVAPPDFAGIYGGLAQSLWIPMSEILDLLAYLMSEANPKHAMYSLR